MTRSTYLARQDSANTSPEVSKNKTPSLPFFSLPRELRDRIYTLCAQATLRSYGPLTEYCEPQTELLTINRQIREEYQVVFYKQLIDILNQNRVCLKLPGGKRGESSKKCSLGWCYWRYREGHNEEKGRQVS